MKKYIAFSILGLIVAPIYAQNISDGIRYSDSHITGTARYRAMAGAFGALGGDPSAMNDNPAGMGIYRGTSEISFTPNLSFAHSKVSSNKTTDDRQSDCSVSNLAYVLSVKTNGDHLVNFNVGIGFNHSASQNRKYQMILNNPSSSFGDYLARTANNYLFFNNRWNQPDYLGSDAAWDNTNSDGFPLSTLYAYNHYMLDDMTATENGQTVGDGVENIDYLNNWPYYQTMLVEEATRNDEYNLNFSGNWDDFIYGGLTLSMCNFNSIIKTRMDEDYDASGSMEWMEYLNNLETKGTGFNIKAGVLIKPTDTWRLGFAAHTPTWFNMEDIYNCNMYRDNDANNIRNTNRADYEEGMYYHAKYRYYSPWQMQMSSAWVIARKALISIEADMKDFSTQKYKVERNGWDNGSYNDMNQKFKDYCRIQMTYKVGGEYRVSDNFSIRAGYAYKGSPYKDELFNHPEYSRGATDGSFSDDNSYLFDSSTKPNHSVLGATDYYTAGLGWSGDWWHIDLSFMNRVSHEKVAAFPTTDSYVEYGMTTDPQYAPVKGTYCEMTTRTLTWDLTLGMKF